jgi:hypothetical protein
MTRLTHRLNEQAPHKKGNKLMSRTILQNARDNRLLALLLLIVMAATGLRPHAQDTQPLPQPFEASTSARAVVIAWQPNSVTALETDGSFVWTNVFADKYVVKIKRVSTGQVIKYKPLLGLLSCGGNCTFDAPAGLFDAVNDGDEIKWRAIAKFTDGSPKLKSAMTSAIVNEIDAPNLIAPVNGSDDMEEGNPFAWSAVQGGFSYILRINDASDGSQVFKQTYSAATVCTPVCLVTSFAIWPNFSGLHTYDWSVTAVSAAGEKDKSDTHSFTLPATISSR